MSNFLGKIRKTLACHVNINLSVIEFAQRLLNFKDITSKCDINSEDSSVVEVCSFHFETFVFIPCLTMMTGCYGIPSIVCSSVRTCFPDNSSYSFHWIMLKLCGQLDHEVLQRIFFQGYSTPSFDRVVTL